MRRSPSEAGFINPSRLYSLLKTSVSDCFVSGHDFSRADKSFIYCYPERRFSPRGDLLFRLLPQPVKARLIQSDL
jgi:hypothetical protein